MPKYWLICTSPENFAKDVGNDFQVEGFKTRIKETVKKVKKGDKFLVYINGKQRFGAALEATSGYYYDDKERIWIEQDEMWPERFKTKLLIVLPDEQLLDVKKLISQLSFVKPRQKDTSWGLAFHQSLRDIPQEDFELVYSEMQKIVAKGAPSEEAGLTEESAKKAIMTLNLQKSSLHDRIGEMLETVGSRMGFNAVTNHKVTPEHAVELDVAWLKGKNPEVAIEIQIGGNIIEAKDKLAQARKFNYRKVIMVIEEEQLRRLNDVVKFDELVDWLEAWSIPAVYKLYASAISFLDLYEQLLESRYKKRTVVEFVRIDKNA